MDWPLPWGTGLTRRHAVHAVQVVHPGVAVQGNVTLPPSIWQYFDLFLTLTDPQPSAARSAVLRFREVHLVTIACEPSLHRFPPSLTAAAAFTCVRRCMRIAPEWPQVLIGVTGHVLVPAPHNRSGGGGGGDEARDTTALGMACELVAETLRLPPFTPSAYQNVLAEGLDGMLRMDQRQNTTESSVAIECGARTSSPTTCMCPMHAFPTQQARPPCCVPARRRGARRGVLLVQGAAAGSVKGMLRSGAWLPERGIRVTGPRRVRRPGGHRVAASLTEQGQRRAACSGM